MCRRPQCKEFLRPSMDISKTRISLYASLQQQSCIFCGTVWWCSWSALATEVPSTNLPVTWSSYSNQGLFGMMRYSPVWGDSSICHAGDDKWSCGVSSNSWNIILGCTSCCHVSPCTCGSDRPELSFLLIADLLSSQAHTVLFFVPCNRSCLSES